MKRLLFYICSILSLFISSCQDKGKVQNKNQQSIIKFKDAQSDEWLNRISYKFIPLETNDSCLISNISNIIFDTSRIYLIDGKSNMVHVFSNTGKYITQVGDVGSGPSEYIMPVALHVDHPKQELIVADANGTKLIYYDLTTFQYKRSIHTDFFIECAWLSNGDIAWLSGGSYQTAKREEYYVKVTDSNLKHERYMCPCNFNPSYRLAAGSCLYNNNDNVYLNQPFLPIVYQIAPTESKEVYTVSIEGHEFASMDWLQANAVDNYMITLTHSDYISTINIKETDSYISLLFYAEGRKEYIGFYDKTNKSSITYPAVDFVKETTLNGFGRVIATYNNYFVSTIFPEGLLEEGTSIEELKLLSRSLKPDNNPILCLFKFE